MHYLPLPTGGAVSRITGTLGKGLATLTLGVKHQLTYLVLSVQLLMHYLPLPTGGAAGAVSRITGTLGKGLATLTLDDDYQKKRREQMNKRPATAREGFARGGKGLVMVSCKHPRLVPLLFRHRGQGFVQVLETPQSPRI